MSDNLDERQKKYLEIINHSGKMLLNVICKMLDISRIESGGMDLHFEKFAVRSVIDDAIRDTRSMAGLKCITVSIDMDTDDCEITADKGKVRAILYNLLENSLKFTPARGTVTLKAGMNGDGVEISVSDTGIGIRESDIGRIFDPFVQVDGSSTRKQGGTGLGLMIVREYVTMHNGDIRVESEYGKGSRFTFTLPSNPEILSAEDYPEPVKTKYQP